MSEPLTNEAHDAPVSAAGEQPVDMRRAYVVHYHGILLARMREIHALSSVMIGALERRDIDQFLALGQTFDFEIYSAGEAMFCLGQVGDSEGTA